MDYNFVVIEHYPDGGTWKHYYENEQYARWGIEDMQPFHRGRRYELIELDKEGAP